MPIWNRLQSWSAAVKKGNVGEQVVKAYLTELGYEVHKIEHQNPEKTNLELPEGHKENTKFSPDFLVISSDNTLFFADAKYCSHKGSLGWVNTDDYKKYYDVSQKNQVFVKIYFWIEETKELWVLDELVEPKELGESFYHKGADGKVRSKNTISKDKFLKKLEKPKM